MPSPEELRKAINKFLGTESLRFASDDCYQTKYHSTGLLPFDILLGGGIPVGRYTIIQGAFSTLKTYMGLNAIAEVQRKGGTAALIDTERTFDASWAEEIGIDTSQLLVWPDRESHEFMTGEQAIDMAELLIRNKVDILVFDSIAAALPLDETSKAMSKGKVQPARLAALMSLAFRRLTAVNNQTSIVMINQLREAVGVMFGNPEKATGGRAQGFYATYIVQMRQAGKEKRAIKIHNGDSWVDSQQIYAQEYVATLTKSKLSKPSTEIRFTWSLDHNEIDMGKFLFAQGVELGLITNKGHTWKFQDRAVKGREIFTNMIREEVALALELENEIRKCHKLPFNPRQISTSLAGDQTPDRTEEELSSSENYESSEQQLTPEVEAEDDGSMEAQTTS